MKIKVRLLSFFLPLIGFYRQKLKYVDLRRLFNKEKFSLSFSCWKNKTEYIIIIFFSQFTNNLVHISIHTIPCFSSHHVSSEIGLHFCICVHKIASVFSHFVGCVVDFIIGSFIYSTLVCPEYETYIPWIPILIILFPIVFPVGFIFDFLTSFLGIWIDLQDLCYSDRIKLIQLSLQF